MGYETALHLVDIRVRPDRAAALKASKGSKAKFGRASFRLFMERLTVDADGFLEFTATGDGEDPYVPFEETDTVPALYGKWYEDKKIARWLKKYSCKGGRLVFHSKEADGNAWAWEFDGKGRTRLLELVPVTKWT